MISMSQIRCRFGLKTLGKLSPALGELYLAFIGRLELRLCLGDFAPPLCGSSDASLELI